MDCLKTAPADLCVGLALHRLCRAALVEFCQVGSQEEARKGD